MSCTHSCGGCCCRQTPCAAALSAPERALLQEFAQMPFLPLARFMLASSHGHHALSVALAPVYLHQPDEPLDAIKRTGALLLTLQDKGLIRLDYDIPLQGYDDQTYRCSAAFRQLKEAVEEGGRKPGFLFDRAVLELGSMALTALGCDTVEELSFL